MVDGGGSARLAAAIGGPPPAPLTRGERDRLLAEMDAVAAGAGLLYPVWVLDTTVVVAMLVGDRVAGGVLDLSGEAAVLVLPALVLVAVRRILFDTDASVAGVDPGRWVSELVAAGVRVLDVTALTAVAIGGIALPTASAHVVYEARRLAGVAVTRGKRAATYAEYGVPALTI